MNYEPWMNNVDPQLLYRFWCSKAKSGDRIKIGHFYYHMTDFGVLCSMMMGAVSSPYDLGTERHEYITNDDS